MNKDRRLQLITGGASRQATVNGVKLEVPQTRASEAPFEVRVFEEDTHLVLTVDPLMTYRDEHPIRLMTGIMRAQPRKPGSVLTRDSSWYAVVYDLDAEPICRREWILKAYAKILKMAEKKGLTSLGLPLLGTTHGNIPARESTELLADSLRAENIQRLKKIFILAGKNPRQKIQELLMEAFE